MAIEEVEKYKDKSLIVFLPKHNDSLKPAMVSTFKNVISIDDIRKKEVISGFLDFVNNGKSQEIILVNYVDFYRKIIANIDAKKNIKWLITHSVASFTNGTIANIFRTIMEFYDRNIVKCIMCTDRGLYELLKKKKFNCEFVKLDISRDNVKNFYKNNGSVGIISNDCDPMHNFYNQLTAMKLINCKNVKLVSKTQVTNQFLEFFDIKFNFCTSTVDAMKNNFVNLYCNFTNSDNYLVLMSMDMGIPCIVGNSDLFSGYAILEKFLVLNSDDDVNEIANKIQNVVANYQVIFKEYNKFRKKYMV